MNENFLLLTAEFNKANELHSRGKINEAKIIYEKIIKIKPDHLLALGNLGIIFSQLKKFEKSIELFSEVIRINPFYPEAHNNLGNVMYELSNFDKALECYKKAVSLNPNFLDVYNNLGNVYLKKENLDKAIQNYNLAIKFDKNFKKDKPYYNLGNIFREQGNFSKSIEFYKKAIKINPNSVSSYVNLSIALNQNGNLEEAIRICKQAVEINPNHITALNNLGEFNQEIGNEKLAVFYYEKAIKINDKNLRSKWLLMNSFPIIYENTDEIDYYNKRFAKNLANLENFVDKENSLKKNDILNALSSNTNFYLHYQGLDITVLQKRYGALIENLTNRIYPEFHKKKERRKNPEIIKVGFVSSFFYDHVVSKLFKNWIIKLNNKKFKKSVYHLGVKSDDVTNLIKNNSSIFYQNSNIENVISKIESDQLDVLVFLDIGMEPKLQILGSLKLAPVQCCAYGVPVTTGFKNIDFFLSGDLMETNSSDLHYSEKLVKLPQLGVDYETIKKINSDKSPYKKDHDRFIFLILQSNFKLLPQHDHIFFEIIKKNKKCKFLFIGTKNKFVAEKFKNRILVNCRNENISFENFFSFYPQASYEEYMSLINNSDAILDSLDWSGFNTSLDALTLDKPIITLPSKYMRGRHTYAILKILKLEELICSSKNEYVNLSIKLSSEPNFYDSVKKKIKLNKELLFNNYNTIKSLEDFFISQF